MNTCSLPPSSAQFILFRSLSSSKSCESFKNTFSFVGNCRNHHSKEELSEDGLHLVSLAHTHEKEVKKQKREGGGERQSTSKRMYASLILSWAKKSGLFAQRRSLWQPPSQEFGSLSNVIYFSLLLLPTPPQIDRENILSQLNPHLTIKRSRDWSRLRMFHKSTLNPVIAVVMHFTKICPHKIHPQIPVPNFPPLV